MQFAFYPVATNKKKDITISAEIKLWKEKKKSIQPGRFKNYLLEEYKLTYEQLKERIQREPGIEVFKARKMTYGQRLAQIGVEIKK